MKHITPGFPTKSALQSKTLSGRILLSLALLLPLISQAQRPNWNANDGDWNTASNWYNDTVPTGQALFGVSSQSPASEINVSISGTANVQSLRIGYGKTINFNMETDAVFSRNNTGDRSDIGTNEGGEIGTGVGSSHVIFNGPASGSATVYLRSFNLGGAGSADGNTLEFNGNINLETSSASIGSAIGRYSDNNVLKLSNGVNAKLAGDTYMGWGGANTSGNQILINGSTLTINNQTSGTPQGARLRIGHDSSNNRVLVEGSGAVLAVNNTLNANTTIMIGTANSSGSELVVRNGGTVQSSNGAQINANNSLIIGANGAYLAGRTIDNFGLLQLADSGTLRGENMANGNAANISLNVKSDGRFEVAGDGLHQTVATTIDGGATLAVGLTGNTTADVFELSSSVTLKDNSVLELTVFNSHEISSIAFLPDGFLNIEDGAILRILSAGHGFLSGDSYQLFTNTTIDSISGSFLSTIELPTLGDGQSWDLSQFNLAGGWQITVVPEPSTWAMLIGGISLAGVMIARRRRA